MHLYLVSIYRHNENTIALVAVRPNAIVDRQHFSSPQIEPSIFIFWENMTYCSKNYPFSIAFKFRFKGIFTKGKTGWVISSRDSRLSAQSTDRRPVKNTNVTAHKKFARLRTCPKSGSADWDATL
jgi:hypothetical protein